MTKKPSTKGSDFEERLRTYFEQAGFYAVRGVPYQFDGEDVSDIDVWLYERPNAISRRRTIVDAKNKQRPKAIERILWLKGFQEGLGVEGAIVATTDRRESVTKFAASLGISVLDGDAVERLIKTEKLENQASLTTEEFNSLIAKIDRERSNKEWSSKFEECKRALSSHLGFQSANLALETAKFFFEHGVNSKSVKKDASVRSFLAVASFAAISLDYSIRDMSFRSFEDREKLVQLGLRYGEGGPSSTLSTVKLALQLARQFAPNGNAVARQIQTRFEETAKLLPVELISEFVAKVGTTDSLYKAARELHRAAHKKVMPRFDDLSVEAKSVLGVLVDYFGVSRTNLDLLLPGATDSKSTNLTFLPLLSGKE